ncbi:MAG: hypothetical protein VYA55_08005 [Pseudomonadota bacterium]|nr:hypothetical protein [Pseudomonadota bacterium]
MKIKKRNAISLLLCSCAISSGATTIIDDGETHIFDFLTDNLHARGSSVVTIVDGYVTPLPYDSTFGISPISSSSSTVFVEGGYYKGSDGELDNRGAAGGSFGFSTIEISGGEFIGGTSNASFAGRGLSITSCDGKILDGKFIGGDLLETTQSGANGVSITDHNDNNPIQIFGGVFQGKGDATRSGSGLQVGNGIFEVHGGTFIGAGKNGNAIDAGPYSQIHIYGGNLVVGSGKEHLGITTTSDIYIYGHNLDITLNGQNNNHLITGELLDGSDINWLVGDDLNVHLVDSFTDLSLASTSIGNLITAPNKQLPVQLLVSNLGDQDAPNAMVEFEIPSGIGWDPEMSSSMCVADEGDAQLVLCSIGDLLAYESKSVGLSIVSQDQLTVSGSIHASVAAEINETDHTNDLISVDVDFSPESDLVIRLVGTNGKYDKDTGEIRYQIVLTNNGDYEMSSLSLVNQLPAGVQFSSVDQLSVCSYVTHQIECQLERLASGQEWVANVVVTTENTGKMLFKAEATTETRDIDLTNNAVEKKFGGSVSLTILLLSLGMLVSRKRLS